MDYILQNTKLKIKINSLGAELTEIINKETNRDNKDKDHMTGEKQAVETLNMIKGNNANEKDILRLDDN